MAIQNVAIEHEPQPLGVDISDQAAAAFERRFTPELKVDWKDVVHLWKDPRVTDPGFRQRLVAGLTLPSSGIELPYHLPAGTQLSTTLKYTEGSPTDRDQRSEDFTEIISANPNLARELGMGVLHWSNPDVMWAEDTDNDLRDPDITKTQAEAIIAVLPFTPERQQAELADRFYDLTLPSASEDEDRLHEHELFNFISDAEIPLGLRTQSVDKLEETLTQLAKVVDGGATSSFRKVTDQLKHFAERTLERGDTEVIRLYGRILHHLQRITPPETPILFGTVSIEDVRQCAELMERHRRDRDRFRVYQFGERHIGMHGQTFGYLKQQYLIHSAEDRMYIEKLQRQADILGNTRFVAITDTLLSDYDRQVDEEAKTRERADRELAAANQQIFNL